MGEKQSKPGGPAAPPEVSVGFEARPAATSPQPLDLMLILE